MALKRNKQSSSSVVASSFLKKTFVLILLAVTTGTSMSSAKHLAESQLWNAFKMTRGPNRGGIPRSVPEEGSLSGNSGSGNVINLRMDNSERPQSRGYGYPYSGGGYDNYSLVAVAAFSALFGALFFQLLEGGILRRSSSSSPSFSLPSMFSADKIPEMMARVGDWIANSKWFEENFVSTATGRSLKDVSDKVGITKWFRAYRKDPVEYQCIRKLACETLANSKLAAKSMKTKLGGIVISAIGSVTGDNTNLLNVVEGTVGNPESCRDMVPWGFCEDAATIEKELREENKRKNLAKRG